MGDPRLREWGQRNFHDPEQVLKDLRSLETSIADIEIPDGVRRLRTGRLKGEREARDAALFAYGLATAVGTKVYVSPGESVDADFITFLVNDGTAVYTPVQLKELVPADLNPNADLRSLIEGLARRPPSDTVLAIRLNRRERVTFPEVTKATVPFAEMWYFWSSTEDASRWALYGDVLTIPVLYEFAYPT